MTLTPSDSDSMPGEGKPAEQGPAENVPTSVDPQTAAPDPDPDVSFSDLVAAFLRWPVKKRVLVTAAALFTAFHIGAVLLRGAPKPIKDPLWPLASWYSDGLRMTDTWGMFSLPPKDKLVSVVGIATDDSRIEISHVQQNERDFKQRVIDIRLRKIQTKLADEKSRNHWGRGYVNYFCKEALARGLPLRRIQLEIQGKPGEAPKIFLSQSCRQNGPARGGLK